MQPIASGSVDGVGGVVLQDVIEKRDRLWMFYPGLLQLNVILLGVIIGDVTNGYDNSMINSLQLLDPWQDFFGSPEGASLGLIVNGTRIGAVGALLVTSPLISWLGRRWPILVGSLICLIGTAFQAAANGVPMFVVSRVVLGFGNTIQVCTCPILISELAHPGQRPQITAILNSTGSLGQILAAWITYSTQSLGNSSWSWRIPSLLQGLSSIVQIVFIFFTPESPRWLVANDRAIEARQILVKYHAEGNEQSELIKHEMAEISYTLEAERSQSRSSWLEWIRTKANRRRLLIITALAFIIQLCGNSVLSYYLRLVLNSVGITSSTTQLIVNGCLNINSFIWGLVFSLLIEHMGRRTLFLGGMAGMFIAFLLLTVLTGVNQSHKFAKQAMSGGSVAAIFVFGVFYKMAAPTQDPYFMEISPYHLRAMTSVIKAFGDTTSHLFTGFVNPIALEDIKWRYYIVWCCVLISNFIVIYLFFPETRGLSLEEVSQLFDGTEIPGQAAESPWQIEGSKEASFHCKEVDETAAQTP